MPDSGLLHPQPYALPQNRMKDFRGLNPAHFPAVVTGCHFSLDPTIEPPEVRDGRRPPTSDLRLLRDRRCVTMCHRTRSCTSIVLTELKAL
ncbi:hypothetical protein F2P81_006275 [Scophthalmus maximus]|uniref:Uncharacterized protein n=1 Tax=Scophthalmus maximus TaxID=52904 RepID=A0A6A4T2R2_SCOMX|nr:hypothetical protein F2P81_006275 [Scophthalmus maximus]